MSYKTQPRDSKGRFIKQEVLPVKKTRRKKQVSNKAIFSCFLLDDTGSISSNKMVDALKSGYLNAVNTINDSCAKNNIEVVYLLGMFGGRGDLDYIYSTDVSKIVNKMNNYDPSRWSTALYHNAIRIINSINNYLTYKEFQGKEVSVQLTILTDGDDNNSFSGDKIELSRMIKKYTENGWNISFMGSKQIAKELLIDQSNILDFETNEVGTQSSMGIYQRSVESYVNTVSLGEDTRVGFFVK
jgi:hypothetical protein